MKAKGKGKTGLMEAEVQILATGLVRALHAMHDCQIAHHELKLKHMMLQRPGDVTSVKLIDFAPSKRQAQGSTSEAFHPPELAAKKVRLHVLCGSFSLYFNSIFYQNSISE